MTLKAYHALTPRYILQLAAPHTWAASICPALFGIVFSWYRGWALSPLKAIALFLTCVLMQSAVNTLNDAVDFLKGTDSKEDHVEVSDAAIVYGNLDPKQVLCLGIAFLAAAAVLGLAASRGSGPLPLVIGIVGGLVVAGYSLGPLPIAYLPLGELISGFVMGGLIPLGIAAVATGAFHPEVLLYSLPFIVGIALIMMSNNGCDIEKDIRAGRQTMAVRLQRENTARLYHVLIMIWFALIIALSALFLPGGIVGIALLVFLSGNAFRYLTRSTLRPEGRIRQMKTIVSANLTANGAYIASVAAALLWTRLRG